MSKDTLSKAGSADIKLWTPVVEVESQAIDQLRNIAALPWVFKHVAVMPDVHLGKGATVGSVVAMKDALSPAMVGVDIGCGMGAIRTNLKASDLPDNLSALRASIEAAVPTGFNFHDRTAWRRGDILGQKIVKLFDSFKDLNPYVDKLEGKAQHQLGTLGGGNHFIEICLDDDVEPNVWIMLHSGSRNIGKCLAEIHISIAQGLAHNQSLPDRDLAVFLSKTKEMSAYRHDLLWAQQFAMFNRQVIANLVMVAVEDHFPQARFEAPILCHHNYVSEETHFGEDVIVTRKGAISARQGELGIIPGSMSTCSYIVQGKGNPESFHSASHGAGRRMSRGQAKRAYSVEDLEASMKGIEGRKDQGVLDEISYAYKDIDTVMAYQADLVEIKARLKQILVVKG